MCSLQTSTGTAWTHLKEENRITAEVDEESKWPISLFNCAILSVDVLTRCESGNGILVPRIANAIAAVPSC